MSARGRAVAPDAAERPAPAGTMKSLRTSLDVLMQFLGAEAALGVAEIAQRTGLPKGQISKILAAFRDHGLLRQDAQSRRYAVGVRAFALGARFATNDRLTREAIPILRELCQRSGHSVRLSILDGDEALYLVGIEGPLFIDTGWRAGTYLPLHSTSAGRVLLAFLEPARAQAVLARISLPALTPHTLTDRAALQRILTQVRARGYSTQRGETTPDLGTIGVPIFGESQRVIGVLGFAFPVHVMPVEREKPLVGMLHDAARVISQRLGCPVYPFGAMTREPAPAAPRRRAATA